MTDLESLKQYIADAVVWVPVLTAAISLVSAWGGVIINNYLQDRFKKSADRRQERRQAYLSYIMIMWASFVKPTVERGTKLSYEEICYQFKTAEFSIVLDAILLVAPDNICKKCHRISDIVNGNEVVSREELCAMLKELGELMAEDLKDYTKRKIINK